MTLSIPTLSITTLSIMALSIMTLSIMALSITTLNITSLSITINKTRHPAYDLSIIAEHCYAECCLCWMSCMLTVTCKSFMLSVIMLSAVMLSVVAPTAVADLSIYLKDLRQYGRKLRTKKFYRTSPRARFLLEELVRGRCLMLQNFLKPQFGQISKIS
jgi:hypothetical protein